MADGLIAITGATGGMGGRVAERLAGRGVRQRLIVRDRTRAPHIAAAEVVECGGYLDVEGMTSALRGVGTLFLVSAHFSDDRVKEHTTAVDSALAAGVKRIVYLSFMGASPEATFMAAREHYRTEQYIRQTGVPFTFLRSSLYADSAVGYFGEDGVVRGPADDGRVSFVARDDIADTVVAIVLTSDGHDGVTYNNTGPEALTFAETAALLTEVTGRPCHFHDETMDEARQSRAHYGAPDDIVDIWISTYTAIAKDELSMITDDIPRLTGHPARTLREFLRDNPDSYQHLLKNDAGK